jgi:hypothetical protein
MLKPANAVPLGAMTNQQTVRRRWQEMVAHDRRAAEASPGKIGLYIMLVRPFNKAVVDVVARKYGRG